MFCYKKKERKKPQYKKKEKKSEIPIQRPKKSENFDLFAIYC